MSLFEFTFGLQAIILGLALAHLVVVLNRLIVARERVKWAAQPLLAAVLVLVTILLLWGQSWRSAGVESTTIGMMILNVLMNLTLFAAAYAVLPEKPPEKGSIDLLAHFEKVRVYFFAVFSTPFLIPGTIVPLVLLALGRIERFGNWENLGVIAGLATCMAVRNRWVNIVVMSALLVWVLSLIQGYELTAGEFRTS